jgi:hypothetical protein
MLFSYHFVSAKYFVTGEPNADTLTGTWYNSVAIIALDLTDTRFTCTHRERLVDSMSTGLVDSGFKGPAFRDSCV